jgi:dTDP-4-dehydrorhamnose 3,5-epimerase
MIFRETKLKSAYVIELERMADERGFFARSWCQEEFERHGLLPRIVQANVSYNHRAGTLRGLHYQIAPHRESKLVRCTRGAIYDVIVDLRVGSPTYYDWLGVELSQENRTMLFVPEGFAHGFQTLVDATEVTYQVSEFYTPGAERGVRYNDSAFNVRWPLTVTVISSKDASWPDFQAGTRGHHPMSTAP